MDFACPVANGNDLASFGALCVSTAYTRDEVDGVLNGGFRAFLELELHGWKAMRSLTTGKYQSYLAALHHYYSDWSPDVFLDAAANQATEESHVDRLLGRLRQKSISTYLSSFSQVSLTSLAENFVAPPYLVSTLITASTHQTALCLLTIPRERTPHHDRILSPPRSPRYHEPSPPVFGGIE